MFSQIKCMHHPEQDIILVDIGQTAQKPRGLCSYCLEIKKPEKGCAIDKLPQRINEFQNATIQDIKLKNNVEKEKFQMIRKYIITLKDRSEQMFKECIKSIEQLIQQIDRSIFEEQSFWSNLSQNVTRAKLDQLAEILSEIKIEPQVNITGQIEQLSIALMENFKQFIADQKDTLNKIQNTMFKKWVIENKTQSPFPCRALTTNKKLVFGGIGKDIYVWEQGQNELILQAVLNGYSDDVTALACFSSGELFVSGGGEKAKSLKLWKKQDQTWQCLQKAKQHSGGITDIQIMKTEEQIFSASTDNTIKVWRMKSSNTQLEYVQSLNNHEYPVFYISISPNCDYLVSTSGEKFFDLCARETSGKWKRKQTVRLSGLAHRIFTTEDQDIILQQENPPQICVIPYQDLNQQQIPIYTIQLQQIPKKHLAPIFQLRNQFFVRNEKFIYVLKKSNTGSYFISQIIPGDYRSGCVDVTGTKILLGNEDNLTIEMFGMY